MRARLLTMVIAFALLITGAHAQDGARAFHLLPENTNVFSVTLDVVHAEIGGSVIDATAVTPSYRRSIDVLGNAGTILIGFPVGGLSASLGTPVGNINVNTPAALGDLFIGGSLGLFGSPSLSPLEYVQYKPGLRGTVSARLFLPTGAYDPNSPLNIGGNRWSLQASLPISYVLGDTMIAADLTTFEIMPTVQIFGDNTNPFGPATVTGQAPLFGLEGHITRNFGQAVWASLDGAFRWGGETSANGVSLGDAQQSFAVGATLGLTFTPTIAVRLSYEEILYSSAPNADGRSFRATSAFLF
jgi:hypothetical protein